MLKETLVSTFPNQIPFWNVSRRSTLCATLPLLGVGFSMSVGPDPPGPPSDSSLEAMHMLSSWPHRGASGVLTDNMFQFTTGAFSIVCLPPFGKCTASGRFGSVTVWYVTVFACFWSFWVIFGLFFVAIFLGSFGIF